MKIFNTYDATMNSHADTYEYYGISGYIYYMRNLHEDIKKPLAEAKGF